MAILVGSTAPEKMLDYTRVSLTPIAHFENQLNLLRFNYEDRLNRMWSRVERDRFQMPASQVNASVERRANLRRPSNAHC